MRAQTLSTLETTRPVRSWHGVTTAVSLTAVAATVLLAVAAPDVLSAAGPVVLAVGVLVGLPHGAIDHLVPAWTGRAAFGRAGMTGIVAGYVGCAVLAWAALSFGGPWALLVLMALSVAHFGLGDVVGGAERDGHPAPRGAELCCAVFARGGPVLVLPMVCWPAQLDVALTAFDPRVTDMLAMPVRLGLLVGLAVCCAVTFARDRATGRGLAAAELLALLVLFTVTPPLAAFGVYFGLWHALRHVARLLLADPRNAADVALGSWRGPVRRYLVAAALPTVGSLVGLAALVVLARTTSLLVPMLSVLMALTVPHVVFVALLDAVSPTRRPPRVAAASAPG